MCLQVEGGKIKIHMKAGWVFGDTALLFQSPRSASVVASSSIQLWAMDRRTFHKVAPQPTPLPLTLTNITQVFDQVSIVYVILCKYDVLYCNTYNLIYYDS